MGPRFFAQVVLPAPPVAARAISDPTPADRLPGRFINNIQVVINNGPPIVPLPPLPAAPIPPAIEADEPARSGCERAASCIGGLVHRMVCGS